MASHVSDWPQLLSGGREKPRHSFWDVRANGFHEGVGLNIEKGEQLVPQSPVSAGDALWRACMIGVKEDP